MNKGVKIDKALCGLIAFFIISTTTCISYVVQSLDEIKQNRKEQITKITQDEKLAEALRYSCINAPRVFKFNTCKTIFEITNKKQQEQ